MTDEVEDECFEYVPSQLRLVFQGNFELFREHISARANDGDRGAKLLGSCDDFATRFSVFDDVRKHERRMHSIEHCHGFRCRSCSIHEGKAERTQLLSERSDVAFVISDNQYRFWP